MIVFVYIFILYILTCFTLTKVFPKAGVEASKAWIPGTNFAEWCKLIGRKPTHALWLLFPIVNIFIWTAMCVDLVRSFNLLTFKDTALSVIFNPAIFHKIGTDDSIKYVGPILEREKAYAEELKAASESGDTYKYQKLLNNNPYKKTAPREWTESIVFAVFAAAFIRMFLIEAYVIPTPSMEGSLNVGDFLFVSKAHYGIRTPSTIAMVPLVHNRVPIINTESYLDKPSLDPVRLPALEKIEVGKPIVFNWPVGDSIYLTSLRSYSVSQTQQNPDFAKMDRELSQQIRSNSLITRPVDKRDHYIKRCLGVAGDSIQIIDRQVYVNGTAVKNPKNIQFFYSVYIPSNVNLNRLEEWGIDYGDSPYGNIAGGKIYNENGMYQLHLEPAQVEKLKSLDPNVKVQIYNPEIEPLKIFPNHPTLFADWTVDNFGPLWIPKKGATIQLTKENIALYHRAINVYEGNDFELKNGKVIINGSPADSYTFKQDYYWAMGDNRHNSEDSRMWGFVPHDHIVGKPLFIWFSTKEGSIGNGINWDRLFKSATKY